MLCAALNMPANLESSAVATRLENVSFHFNPKQRQCQRMFKLPHNCTHLTCCKVMLKFSKPGFKSTWTENLQTFKLGLEKSEEPEIKLRTSVGPQEKQKSSRKTFTSALLTMSKPLTVWITTNYGKFFKRREYQTTLPASWEICIQVKENQLESDMEQWTGSLGQDTSNCILSPCLLNLYAEYIMWNAGLDEAQAGIKIAGRNINNLRYADDTTLMAESKEELKSFW